MPLGGVDFIKRNTVRSAELGCSSKAKFMNSGEAEGGGGVTHHLNTPFPLQ